MLSLKSEVGLVVLGTHMMRDVHQRERNVVDVVRKGVRFDELEYDVWAAIKRTVEEKLNAVAD